MVVDSTLMSPSTRHVTHEQLRSLFFTTTNQDREQSLISARGRPFALPKGFRPRLARKEEEQFSGVLAGAQPAKAAALTPRAPRKPAPKAPPKARSDAAGSASQRRSSASNAPPVAPASAAESIRQEVREALVRETASGAASRASKGSQPSVVATREQVEAEAKRLGIVIDWNKFSTYGTDFKQPGPKCYIRDMFAAETKIRVQKSSVPFTDPRRMPGSSVTQTALAEAQARRLGPALLAGPNRKKRTKPFASDGCSFEGVTMYRQDMTGELSERRAPFSPRNIPGQPVISMSEILLDPERFGDLLQVLEMR